MYSQPFLLIPVIVLIAGCIAIDSAIESRICPWQYDPAGAWKQMGLQQYCDISQRSDAGRGQLVSRSARQIVQGAAKLVPIQRVVNDAR